MILIVEDEILIRSTLSDYLQDCGLKVLEASNAAEAIEILQAGQTTIELVFTDVMLAGEMKRIRSAPSLISRTHFSSSLTRSTPWRASSWILWTPANGRTEFPAQRRARDSNPLEERAHPASNRLQNGGKMSGLPPRSAFSPCLNVRR
jgi:hypothetical protein